jgi:hypothetical protein
MPRTLDVIGGSLYKIIEIVLSIVKYKDISFLAKTFAGELVIKISIMPIH